MVSKDLQSQLIDERQLIKDGKLKDENPLEDSAAFIALCNACRKGDARGVMAELNRGVNVNGRDNFDSSPLQLASLCGHYEIVQMLLENGAVCQRDTFQGERCIYNALTLRIRDLLLQWGYTYSDRHPLQAYAGHITSLLSRDRPRTSDITLASSIQAHKFILAARCPYFRKKLASAATNSWKPVHIPEEAVELVVQYLYLSEAATDIPEHVSGEAEQHTLLAVERLSRQLEISEFWDTIIDGADARVARQRRADEFVKCQTQLQTFFRENVLKYRVIIDKSKANNVRWDRSNSIFADVLLRADDADDEEEEPPKEDRFLRPSDTIPIGPMAPSSRSSSRIRRPIKSTLFPAHRAMLIRCDFFLTMFSSSFKEAQSTEHLQIIQIDCTPRVLEIVLAHLYTEQADIPAEIAIDVLLAADLLLIPTLKTKATAVITTQAPIEQAVYSDDVPDNGEAEDVAAEDAAPLNIYDIIRAGWLCRVRRLEEFGAKWLAEHLEDYIDEDEFAVLIKESASRLEHRQQTDSIELLDDIRYHLSGRFRLRFEDPGLGELMDEEAQVDTRPDQNGDREPIPAGADSKPKDVTPNSNNGQIRHPSVNNVIDRTLAHDNLPSTGQDPVEEDEDDVFSSEAMMCRSLLEKIDLLLQRLGLDA